jgi:hypothetical protein
MPVSWPTAETFLLPTTAAVFSPAVCDRGFG